MAPDADTSELTATRRPRRAGGGLALAALHLFVLGASAVVAWRMAPSLVEGAGGAGRGLYWAVLGLAAVGLAAPGLALPRSAAWGMGWPLASAVCGLLAYGGMALVALLTPAGSRSGATLWAAMALFVAVPAALLAVRTKRIRFAAALMAAVGACGAIAWAPWGAGRGETVREAWLMAVAYPATGAVVMGTAATAALCLLLLMVGVRRRAVWWVAVALGLATGPAWWAGAGILRPRAPDAWGKPRLTARPTPLPEEWSPTDPAGPFRDVTGEAVLGWRWANVGSGPRWREALIVQPPCRLTGRIATSGGGVVRLAVALPRQRGGTSETAVLVRCTATDKAGRTVGECSRTLRTDDLNSRLGNWEELSLEVSGAAGAEAALTLEAKAATADAPTTSLPMLAVAASPVVTPAPDPAGPNCLVILVDTLRADRLHCYGFPQETSPYIDRLASQGALFERVTSACSWTVPSVASLFTGTYVSTHGMARFRMPARLPPPTLAEQFRKAGLRTAAVSSNEAIIPPAGFGAGFDVFVSPFEFTLGLGDCPRADWVTDQAIALLQQLNGYRFFLYLHYMDPHLSYDPPPGWAVFGYTEEQRYLGEIRYCDNEIGRLLDELDALGRTNDTLVVFIADHGEAFMEHGFRLHGNTLHREEVEVPLILRFPGRLRAGGRVPSLVRSIDAHATMAELMGLPVPRHVEGESLVPLAGADQPGRDRVAFSELILEPHHKHPQEPRTYVSLEQQHYKLILRIERGHRCLYDVRRDPDEQTDLVAERPDLAATMQEKIRRFLKARKGVPPPSRPPTAEERRRLGNLGYLDPGPLTRPAAP